MEVFIKPNGIQQGPFSKDELQRMMDEGKVGGMVLAIHEGLSNWMPLAAVLAPRAQPPPFHGLPSTEPGNKSPTPVPTQTEYFRVSTPPEPNPQPDGFMEQRGNFGANLAARVRELKQADWKGAFPLDSMLEDKPWNLLWVRWLLLFALVPSLLYMLLGGSGGSEAEASLGVGAYVALLWAFGLRLLLKPAQLASGSLLLGTLAPLMAQTGILLIGGSTHSLDRIFSATGSGGWVSKPIAIFAVAALAQVFVTTPLLLRCLNHPTTVRTMVFAGSLAGLAMGTAPNLAHTIGHRWLDSFRLTSLGAFQSQPHIGLISWMLVSGLLCGMLAFVIHAAVDKRKYLWPVAVTGILASSLLMTLYHLTSGRLFGLAMVAVIALFYAAYVRITDQHSSPRQI